MKQPKSRRAARIAVALGTVLTSLLAAAAASAAPPPKQCILGPARVGGIIVDVNRDGCFP